MPKMLIWSVVLLLSNFAYCQKQYSGKAMNQPVLGAYIALEKMPSVTPDDPEIKWFHENTLFVRSNEAILDMVPVSIKRARKTYSASDGGFLTYRGRFFQNEGKTFIELRLFQSDYIAIPKGRDVYKETITRNVELIEGGIEIGGVRYKRIALSDTRRNELLQMLDREPMEKPTAE